MNFIITIITIGGGGGFGETLMMRKV